ncbi:FAD-binding oxidoreductase [Algoriphagus aquimarinus]|uniref:2Fe-2S iron-sulfur cluster binding domain-containing protein n=1 Tax=Algoriphagus aquimarinus TaxID=237018 RepID=A0A5C7AA75_9BACT|nr:FAD-binding oxidoreductase [Algoriphagus aquimarinus]TXE02124.1 2Fe-2S iron-sulfur cluster binding domain-containing protein [Algoriphagus aquimarinus]
MFQIQLLNNKSFQCDPNDTIVHAALKGGVFVEHSCLSGRCSSCKVLVESGESIALHDELTLTKSEKREGYILACIRKPLSDLKLATEDLGEYGFQKPKTIPIKVNSIQQLNEDIIKVSLRFPPNQSLSFLPGQYVDIIKGYTTRSYSIANASDQGFIDLIIKKYEGGVMSDYWFNHVKTNDLLRLEGPKGTFFLRKKAEKDILVFLATGTGIAPIKSICEDKNNLEELNKYKEIFIFWGMKHQNEVFWQPQIENLKINFIPVLSRENNLGSPKKYVQHTVLDQNIDFSTSIIYACGANEMILEAKKKLMAVGLSESDFYSDAFVSSN